MTGKRYSVCLYFGLLANLFFFFFARITSNRHSILIFLNTIHFLRCIILWLPSIHCFYKILLSFQRRFSYILQFYVLVFILFNPWCGVYNPSQRWPIWRISADYTINSRMFSRIISTVAPSVFHFLLWKHHFVCFTFW